MQSIIKLTEDQERAIIAFYLEPNSLTETYRHFNFKSSCRVRRVLQDYGIPEHSQEIRMQCKTKKCKATCVERYGVENVFAASNIKEKIKATTKERYGVENIQQLPEIQEKIKQTLVARYGVENPSQIDRVKEKKKQTCLQHFGVPSGTQCAEVQDKIKQTILARYGVEYPLQAEAFKSKLRQTTLDRFGVEYYAQSDEFKQLVKDQHDSIRAKVRQTSLERFGVEHYSQTVEYSSKKNTKLYCDGTYFDSLPELAVWLYCKEHSIPIKRHPTRLPYTYAEKLHYYIPDFEINGKLVEIKGDHFFASDGSMRNPYDSKYNGLFEAKHQCMINHNISIWTSSQYNKYLAWFNTYYSKSDFIRKA